MFHHTIVVIIILAFGGVLACPLRASPEFGGKAAPASQDGVPGGEYKIKASELLEITVYQQPDLSRTVRVTGDGYISMPLIGKVRVCGCSVTESGEKIAGLLRKYLVNPQVTVFVKEYYQKKVFILGEVRNPGSYDIPPDRELTILEAITLAGGFTKLAAVNKTKILRIEGGKQKYIEIKMDDIMKRGEKNKDIILSPADVIVVPERVF